MIVLTFELLFNFWIFNKVIRICMMFLVTCWTDLTVTELCGIITEFLEQFSADKKNSSNLWEVIADAHAKYIKVCC